MSPSRAGRPDKHPFVLVHRDRGALRITALDAVAARGHLAVGMALAEARVLWPDLETAEADPEADAAFLRHAADTCCMFTPLVALHDSDGLVLDITGCAHLFGSEAGLLSSARGRLGRLGLDTSAAIAGTPDSAWAFARHRPSTIAQPHQQEMIAKSLPISALNQDAATTAALRRAGFETLGDLADRPPAMLTSRFGAGLASALRRVLGHEDIRIIPLRPAPEMMAERHFPEPLALIASLLEVFERLVRDIVMMLKHRGDGGRAFEASFFRSDGALRQIRIETAQATRDAASLMRLLQLKIESLADPLDPGFGFDALRLAVMRSEPLPERQTTLEGGVAHGQADDLAALVDRLAARLGRDNIRRFIGRDTHDPVRAGASAPCLSTFTPQSWSIPEAGQPPARPLTLFDPPQLIDAMAEVPDGPPTRFRWRRVLHDVARAEGPERLAPEWWRVEHAIPDTRDYYRLEDAHGHRFWVFREGFYGEERERPRWFMHGLFA